MSPDLKKCEEQALKLPPEERAILAEHLLSSLDQLSESEIELAWLDEAEKRYAEYKKGNLESVSAKEALKKAREMLQ